MSRRRARRRRREEAPLRLTGWRRVVIPLVVTIGFPLALLGTLEAGLRLAGTGYDPRFLRPVAGAPTGARGHWSTNPRFGWRFFPRRIARRPQEVDLPPAATDDAVRIFILGGSAAMGTPEPAFSFGRILEVMLAERHPGRRFRVVNAAMAAINSHVVLPIAEEIAARHRPDVFVVYLGNNEVIGPYGPGTVFATYNRWRPVIRTGLWLKTLRTGQLLAVLADRLLADPGAAGEWRGLEMFSGRDVPLDDPRLATVDRHFERNLEAIADAAGRAGAGLVLATVAVDLVATPPFGAQHRPDLGPTDERRWNAAVATGAAAYAAGDAVAASRAFGRALELDDRHAEAHYRQGLALLALGRSREARRELLAARDLDTLRLRADSGIERVIRRVAARRARTGSRVALADAEAALEDAGGRAPPGSGAEPLFHEHVHLTFHGNYLLARRVLPAVEALLAGGQAVDPVPAPSFPPPSSPPPSEARCARLLALGAGDRAAMAATILQLTSRPPFTRQIGHAERTAERRGRLQALRRQARASAAADLAALRAAVERRPDDLPLRTRLARDLAAQGHPAEAAGQWRELLARLPEAGPWHTALGFALADQGDLAGAERELRRVVALEPEAAAPRVNLGTVRLRQGHPQDARRLDEEALRREPDDPPALLNLARLDETDGDFAAALARYETAIAASPEPGEALARLAEAWDRHGDLEHAVAAYRRALAADPLRTRTWNNLGYALERQGDGDAALHAYARAVATDPTYALARFNLGDLLLRQGRAGEAAASYRAGLAAEPANPAARRNLALAEELLRTPPGTRRRPSPGP